MNTKVKTRLKKILYLTLGLLVGFGVSYPLFLSNTNTNVAKASVNVNKTKIKTDKKGWEKAVVVYGAYLENDNYNRDVTDNLLGKLPNDEVGYVYSEDAQRFTGAQFSNDLLKSSIRIQKTKTGSGLDVHINTDGGAITKVTEDMYRNALMTSGIYDAKVEIASFETVTGESALSGVFKAQEIVGEDVDEDVTNVAQEELSTVADINEQNEGEEGYSQEQLNKAIAEIKTEVAEQGGDLSEEEVREIVDEKVDNNGLTDYITDEQKNQIVVIIINGQNAGIFSGDNAKQLIKSGKDTVNKIMDSDEYKQAKEKASELGNKLVDTVQSEGFWEKVKEFVVDVIDGIKNLFTK